MIPQSHAPFLVLVIAYMYVHVPCQNRAGKGCEVLGHQSDAVHRPESARDVLAPTPSSTVLVRSNARHQRCIAAPTSAARAGLGFWPASAICRIFRRTARC